VQNFDGSKPAGISGRPILPLILASGSPRRLELLKRFWNCDDLIVMVPEFDEDAAAARYQKTGGRAAGDVSLANQAATGQAESLSAGKLQALGQQFQLPENYIALAADTIVVLDSQILGKPVDKAAAVRMLRLLSGRTHQVTTGVCLNLRWQGKSVRLQGSEVTEVRFAELTGPQIEWYAGTGEPLDKAGAYGIQGYGAALIERIDGCYYNVMGLPVHRLMVLLQQAVDRFSSYPELVHLLPWN